jgi:hypothetical protein
VVSRNKRHILGIGSGDLVGRMGSDNVIIFGGGSVGILDRRVHHGEDESVAMIDYVTRIRAMLKVGGRREGVVIRRRRRERKRKIEKVVGDSQLGKSDGERRWEVVWKTPVRQDSGRKIYCSFGRVMKKARTEMKIVNIVSYGGKKKKRSTFG